MHNPTQEEFMQEWNRVVRPLYQATQHLKGQKWSPETEVTLRNIVNSALYCHWTLPLPGDEVVPNFNIVFDPQNRSVEISPCWRDREIKGIVYV